MAKKKSFKKIIKQKIKDFSADGKLSKKDTRRIAKTSGGELSNPMLKRMMTRYGNKNDIKIKPKKFGGVLRKFNIGAGPGDKGAGNSSGGETFPGGENDETKPDKFDRFTTKFQDQLDGMFAGQDARDAELERQEQERLRQFELAQRTMLGNEGRSGQQATYRLGGAAGRMKGGTSGFKRRKGSGASRIMSGLSTNSGGTLNV